MTVPQLSSYKCAGFEFDITNQPHYDLRLGNSWTTTTFQKTVEALVLVLVVFHYRKIQRNQQHVSTLYLPPTARLAVEDHSCQIPTMQCFPILRGAIINLCLKNCKTCMHITMDIAHP